MTLLSFAAGILQWLAVVGVIIAIYDYYLHRKPASLAFGLVFLIGWLLPVYSMHLLLLIKSPVVRFLIPNNPAGLIVSILLTAGPWLYFLPRLKRLKRRKKRQ